MSNLLMLSGKELDLWWTWWCCWVCWC